jgi:hypothetical protein
MASELVRVIAFLRAALVTKAGCARMSHKRKAQLQSDGW